VSSNFNSYNSPFNQSTRQAADNAKRFHKHNVERQARADSLRSYQAAQAARQRRRQQTPSSSRDGFPGDADDEGYAPVGRARRSGRIVWALLVMSVLGIAGVALISTDIGSIPGGSSGVDGIVREGTEWNVRGGPGMAFPSIAVVHPGEAVVVTCLEQGWAQLESPNDGAFVYSEGLALNGTPPPC
jgi:hypothetical protein